MGLRAEDAGLARRRRRRRARGLHRRGLRGRGRPRRDPPAAGHPGRRPRGALELQGRQVRLVQRRDQRPAAAAVHDPALGLRARARPSRSRRCAPSRSSATWSPTSPTTTRRPRSCPSFAPPPRDADGKRRMAQVDVERGQEFRKCIECFLCQNVCHVVRDHEDNKPAFAGPRFFLRYAELDMHPLDTHDRRELAQDGRRHRHVQHHQVLHRGLPRGHQDHRQRDHPDEGARGRQEVRPAGVARRQDRPPQQGQRRPRGRAEAGGEPGQAPGCSIPRRVSRRT